MSLFTEETQETAAPEKLSGPRIEYVSIHNIGRVDDAEINYQGGLLVKAVGPNGIGKSTTARTIYDAIRGKIAPDSLKKGADKGTVDLKFTYKGQEFRITVTLTRLKSPDGEAHDQIQEALQFIGPDEKPISQARAKELVRFLVGDEMEFDVNEFITTPTPAKRSAMLQRLSGIDLSPFNLAVKQAETARTDANRDVKNQESRALPFDAELAAKEPVDAAALAAQKSEIEAHNATIERSKEAKATIEAQIQGFPSTLASIDAEKITAKEIYETELARLKAKFDADNQRIDERAKAVKDAQKDATERLKRATEWLENPDNQPKDKAPIEEQLSQVSATNAAITEAKRLKRESDELERLKAIAQEKEIALTKARDAKMTAIKGAKLPANLEFDPNDETGLLYNGVALEKASDGEITLIGIELATMSTGEMKWLHVDTAKLDVFNFQKVCDDLKERGYQALLERPSEKLEETSLQFHVVG